MVEKFGDLAITVFIEKPVDFGNQFWLELADLSDWQGPIEPRGARGSARRAHVGSNRVSLDQGCVGDKQAQDPFALADDTGIGPNPRELFRERQDGGAF
ncbi:hypothetical protein [Mesorhizobium sp. M1339]|uniref:hypothetical protein n=1 Tax=Mesorhizobium sp. M1339 TaxID=2957086 RepID=UPI00333AF193